MIPKQIEDFKANYFARYGTTPSDNDAKWSILSSELLKHSKGSNWGLYRNTSLSMASVLEQEGGLRESLHTYLEVCYIDLNGPNNVGGFIGDPGLLSEYPPFSSREAFLAPLVVTKVNELATRLQLNDAELQSLFHESAIRVFHDLKLPISPDSAWTQLQQNMETPDQGVQRGAGSVSAPDA